jgi:5-oxoprolinase (ATP-hydrolysing) subunit A
MTIDLNADLGEGAGSDGELLELVSSANISCGAHAGDAEMIAETLAAAKRLGVSVGAHPSYPDRANFGRVAMVMAAEEIRAFSEEQLATFSRWASVAGVLVRHVKPHGALYNVAARDRVVAGAIVAAVLARDGGLRLYAPAGSALEKAGAEAALQVVAEFFADRNYLADGSLVPRTEAEAMIHDVHVAAERVLRVLERGSVTSVEGVEVPMRIGTICLHGDAPEAVAAARVLRERLERAGVRIAAPVKLA